MKRHFVVAAVAVFATAMGLRADTSYLLIQGPFGPGAAEETFKWQVNYAAGTLETGQDLLNAVFGAPSFSGTYYTDLYGDSYPYWTAGNGAQGLGYVDYTQYGSFFLASVTLALTTVLQDPSYSPGWSYYVAGGGSNYGTGYEYGAWTYSNDGLESRSLANGSFDAWLFGSTNDPPVIQGANNAPVAADFAGATVVNMVPDPGSTALFVFGSGAVLGLYRWRRYRP